MSVRRLLLADAAQYQAVRLRGLQECPVAFSSSYAEEVDTPLEKIVARLAHQPDGAIFGYFDGTVLKGVIGVQRESMAKLAHKGFIWGMYVALDARHMGAGRALMTHALGYARDELGVAQVNLGVGTQNAAAIALYQHVGFEVFGTERGYLQVDGVPHDEHHMVCRLMKG